MLPWISHPFHDTHTPQEIHTVLDTQRNLPADWWQQHDEESPMFVVTDTPWGCCCCLLKCMGSCSFYGGYILLSILVPKYGGSLFYLVGLFVVIGAWGMLADLCDTWRDADVKHLYARRAVRVSGTIIDRDLTWTEIGTKSVNEKVVATDYIGRYSILVEYRVEHYFQQAQQQLHGAVPTQSGYQFHYAHHDENAAATSPSPKLAWKDGDTVVVHKAFSVTEALYNDSHQNSATVQLLVLPEDPRSAVLEIFADPYPAARRRPSRSCHHRRFLIIGIVCWAIAASLAIVSVLDTGFGTRDIVAIALEGPFVVLASVGTVRNSHEQVDDLMSGRKTAKIHSVIPRGGHQEESLYSSSGVFNELS